MKSVKKVKDAVEAASLTREPLSQRPEAAAQPPAIAEETIPSADEAPKKSPGRRRAVAHFKAGKDL